MEGFREGILKERFLFISRTLKTYTIDHMSNKSISNHEYFELIKVKI